MRQTDEGRTASRLNRAVGGGLAFRYERVRAYPTFGVLQRGQAAFQEVR